IKPSEYPAKKTWNVGTKNAEELKRITEEWTYDMKEYFKNKCKEVCRMKNENESKDDFVIDENEAAKNLVADEIDGVDARVLHN
ncbi:hypothetical protein Tco_0050901, partial [Tanacetum coccineum]